MGNIFDFLNNNSGLLTLLAVLGSFVTCIISLMSAKAAWAQVREMRKQYAEENRPNVEVEFLYSNRSFYGLRFVNYGKCTAQNVKIELDSKFIDALEPNFAKLLRKQEGKSCVIGVGQHYDLYFGSSDYRKCLQKPPAKGSIRYQANGNDYKSTFQIDLECYATIFSVNNEREILIKKLNEQNNELKGIKKAISHINLHTDEEIKNV